MGSKPMKSIQRRGREDTAGAAAVTTAALMNLKGVIDNRDLRLGFLIHDVSRLRRIAFDLLMKPMGVTRSQWWVLAYVSRHDGMMQTELAALLDVGKVTLGGLVDRLESSKLVERRPDPADRRAKRIHLTAAAQKLLMEMRNAEDRMNARILRGINAKQRSELTEMLTRIKDNLAEVAAAQALPGDADEDEDAA
jgi:MarR family transcriptional regulator, transcriptional regulator for hemolysin